VITSIDDRDKENAHTTRIKEILCNYSQIETLSKKAGQPFLRLLADKLMLMTIEEDEELSSEKLDFICSFLHRSLYKSLINEEFFKFYEFLNFKYPVFNAEKDRKKIFNEISLKNNELKSLIDDEIKEIKENNSSWNCSIY
jgi:hypothetical protein